MENNYRWEADRLDGTTRGGGPDITDATCLRLVPTVPNLPLHEIRGVPMVRRFGRGFGNVLNPGTREYLQCVVCRDFRIYVRSSDGSMIVTPADTELYL